MPDTPLRPTGEQSTLDTHEPLSDHPGGSSPQESRRAALSSFVGTTVEFYDFLLYGSAAALVFNRTFFNNLSPAWATVASFATFAAGYIARLIGGLAFAHFGDKSGRKSVLIITMLMMGISTGLIGLLPTYDQIGAAAPILLLTLRLVQGLAAGGEYGGAALMSAEHSPNKRRGLQGSATSLGLPFGGLLGTGAFLLVSNLPVETFLSWGWRIPFIAGFVLVAIGLWIRLKVSETPAFTAAHATAVPTASKFPAAELLRRQPLTVLRGVLLTLPAHAIASLFGTYLLAYAVSIGYTSSQSLMALMLSSIVAVIAIPIWGALSDLLGRRPVFLIGAVGVAALAYPSIALVNTGTFLGLTLAQVLIGGLISTAMSGPMVAVLTEMFDTDVRYTGVAMTYQTGTVIAGGFSPLVAALIAASSGTTGGGQISLLLLAFSVGAAIATLFSAESRGRDLTKSVIIPSTPR